MKQGAAGMRAFRFGAVLGHLLTVVAFAAPAFGQGKPAAAVAASVLTVPPTDAPAVGAPRSNVPATGSPVSAVMDVTFKDGKLSVKAEKVDLAALLRKIAETVHVAVDISPDVTGQVSASFADQGVEDAIKKVLKASGRTNFAAEFRKGGGAADESVTLERIIIASGKQGQMAGQPAGANETVHQPNYDALFAYVEKKYGKSEEQFDDGTGRLRLLRFHESGVSKRIHRGNIEEYCKSKFDELFPFLGLSMDMVRLTEIRENPTSGTTCVYGQEVHSVPVENAAVSITVWNPIPGMTDLVSIGTGAHPDITISTEPKLTADEAVRIAQVQYRRDHMGRPGFVEDDVNESKPTQLVVYPKGDRPEKASRYDYYLTWKIDLHGGWFYIDALSGKVVSWGSNIGSYPEP